MNGSESDDDTDSRQQTRGEFDLIASLFEPLTIGHPARCA